MFDHADNSTGMARHVIAIPWTFCGRVAMLLGVTSSSDLIVRLRAEREHTGSQPTAGGSSRP